MVEISKFREKAAFAQNRVHELRQSFLDFATVDKDLRFVADPQYKAVLSPYVLEVKKLEEYHAAIQKAIHESYLIYNKLCPDSSEKEKIEFTDHIRDLIGGLHSAAAGALAHIERLKIVDRVTLETIIPEAHKTEAEELKKLINVEIPAKKKGLQEAQSRIEKLFTDLPDIKIPAPGENLPKREGEA